MFTFLKKKSLTYKLLSRIVISAVIPCTLVSLFLIVFTQQQIYRMGTRNNVEIAKKTAGVVYWNFESIKIALEAVMGSKGFRTMEQDRQRILLENLMSIDPYIEEISVLNLNGKEIIKLINEKGRIKQVRKLKNLSKERGFISARKKGIHWSSVYLCKEDCLPNITLFLRFEGVTGEPAGILSANICLHKVWSIISSAKIGKKGYLYLVDSQGKLIIHPEEKILREMKDLSFLPPSKKFSRR